MSNVHLIDTITDWVRDNVCARIQLKQPPADLEAANDARLDYQLVTPAAFGMYIPTTERLPPNIRSPYPAVCVRVLNGEDNAVEGTGWADVQLVFCTWDTGLHGEDYIMPNGDGTHRVWSGEEADAFFRRHGEGWRDAWNFADIALRALESVVRIGDYPLERATPIRYGPLTEQEAIPDYYPYWYAWVTFRVQYPLVRNIVELQDFL